MVAFRNVCKSAVTRRVYKSKKTLNIFINAYVMKSISPETNIISLEECMFMNWKKSFDKLFYNIKDMIKVNTNIKVLLVGGGPDLDNLKELTKKLNLENYVIFTDKVNYDLVPTYFNIFNVVVSFKTIVIEFVLISIFWVSNPM